MKAQVGLALVISLILKSSTWASSPSDSPEIQTLIQNRQLVSQSEVERRRVLSEIYKIHRQIRKFGQERGFYEHERRVSQKKVTKISDFIAKLEVRIQKQRDLLRGRVRSLSKFGGQNLLRLVFSSQNPGELDRNIRYLKVITRRDYALFQDYKRSILEYKSQQQNLRNASQRLALAEQRYQQRESDMIRFQKEKSELLKKIDTEKLIRITQIKRLRLEALNNQTRSSEGETGQLAKLKTLENALQPSFFEMKGQLKVPVEASQLAQGFGDFQYKPRSIDLRHKGVFWTAAKRTPVKSVHPGMVRFAGWLNSYEKVVVLSHGDHYYSIYGSLEEVRVKTGDQVNTEQEIGLSGTSAFGLGPGTYFEIRHFSEPLNPLEWIGLRPSNASTETNQFPSFSTAM